MLGFFNMAIIDMCQEKGHVNRFGAKSKKASGEAKV